MKTGAGGLDSLGNIDRWNYNSTTTAYPGPCGKVKGSSGELWPINTAAKQHAEIFVTDICRFVVLCFLYRCLRYGGNVAVFLRALIRSWKLCLRSL